MKRNLATTAVIMLLLSTLCGCSLFKQPIGGTSPLKTLPPASQGLYPSGQPIATGTKGTPTGASAPIPSIKASSTETPAPAIQSTVGEIPQAQSFIYYSSTTGHYDVQVPEGWTPTSNGENIKFTHKYDGVQLDIIHTADPFTLDNIRNKQVVELIRSGRAVTVKNISMATTNSGQAVLVEYESNSDPSIGNKIRLTNQRYYFPTTGKLAVLSMWAPAGSDNSNIWKQIPDTFVWK